MEIHEIMKVLVKNGISTAMHYNIVKDQYYIDLETNAKSELHLYENGLLCGRYSYEKQIDLTQDVEEIITELCHEFNNALHGRNYCQEAWAKLCWSKNIRLNIF